MAFMLVGLVAGWPLMHASVAAEAEDLLDALSRIVQLPQPAAGQVRCCAWPCLAHRDPGPASGRLVGTGGDPPGRLGSGAVGSGIQPGRLDGSRCRRKTIARTVAAWPAFWRGVVGLLARGWIYAYFWTAASFIYLLLRHDVDGTPWTDVKDA